MSDTLPKLSEAAKDVVQRARVEKSKLARADTPFGRQMDSAARSHKLLEQVYTARAAGEGDVDEGMAEASAQTLLHLRPFCTVCGESQTHSVCTCCGADSYCVREHQKQDWDSHRGW